MVQLSAAAADGEVLIPDMVEKSVEKPGVTTHASSAIVKVRHKDAVLRIRVHWPLDASEVISLVSATLHGLPSSTPCSASASEGAAVGPIVLYQAAQGSLLELCDANASDFIARHSDPAQPIRLVTAVRRPTPIDQCLATESEAPVVGQTGPAPQRCDAAAECKELPTKVSTGAAPAASLCPKSDGTDTCNATNRVSATRLPGTEMSQEPPLPSTSVGADFISEARSKRAVPPPVNGPSRPGVSLPVAARRAADALSEVPGAARKAADVLGDALEGALDKFNGALATPWLLPGDRELQRALQASAELQLALQKSAAESRKRLTAVLDLYKAKLRPVEADGNCQFRALCVQLFGDEAHHAALRSRVVQQLRERRDRYEGYMQGTFDEYLERMARDGEWGDNVTLQAASDLLGCEILLLTDNTGSKLLELSPEIVDKEARRKPLCLAFLTEVHYDAVVLEGECLT